ncbi:hypothetical protein LJC33_06535 [Eubacteriales bacterium OttesenSCG-928-N13]|nr:hypothetical protein [Eubacteriales bacterium OttesenSCG-928-N13]
MFTIQIKTGGASFRDEHTLDKNGNAVLDPTAHEVRSILKDIIRKLSDGYTSGKIMDINGNSVGQWRYE